MRGGMLWNLLAIALLAWGVSAPGAVEPWAYFTLLAGMATYGTAALLKRVEDPSIGRGLRLSLIALGGAILVQLVPLPAGLVDTVSPAAAPAAAMTDAALAHGQPAARRPLSIDPEATARGLANVVALGLFFLGMVRTMGRDGTRRLATGIAGLGTLVALVGITEVSTSWGGVYDAAGLALPPDSMPHGPFSSRNHYAGWMLMTLAVTMGFLCGALDQAGLLRERVQRGLVLLPQRIRPFRMIALQGAAITMAVALVQTRSRAGLLCLALAVLAIGGLLMRRGTSVRARIVVTGLLVLLPVTGIAVAGVQPIADRFAVDSWGTAHGRLPIWRQALAIARDFPVAGSGFNTYQTIVPLYPTADLDEPYEAAHNDYLQLAVEGGVLLAVPALAALGFFAWEIRRRFRESFEAPVSHWVRSGAVVGLLLVAVQESVEFNLQIPGNAALFVALAAIAVHRTPA